VEGVDHCTYLCEGPKIDCSNYRGILISHNTYKTLYRMLMSMLTPYAEDIIGIINVDFEATVQLLLLYFVFVKYVRKMGIERSSASTIYRLQGSL